MRHLPAYLPTLPAAVDVRSADLQAFTVALNVSIIFGATVGIGKPDTGKSIFFRGRVRG